MGILGAVWKATPTLIWAMRQSICLTEEEERGGQVLPESSTATLIEPAVDSGSSTAGNLSRAIVTEPIKPRVVTQATLTKEVIGLSLTVFALPSCCDGFHEYLAKQIMTR